MKEEWEPLLSILSQLQSDPVSTLIALLYRVPAVLIALTLHELAHGYVALRCGDPTAQMMGRLSFNPLRHLDPVGTAFMLLFGFGWARPVPVNPRNFKHFRRDDLLVSIAGIVMNFCLFFLTTLLMVGLNRLIYSPAIWSLGPLTTQKDFLSFRGWNFSAVFMGENRLFVRVIGDMGYYTDDYAKLIRTPWLLYVQRFFMNFSMINLGLALFNLLPIPPLDGYHVVNDIFIRGRLHIPQRIMNICMIVLLVVCFATDVISNIVGQAIYAVQDGVLDAILFVFGMA